MRYIFIFLLSLSIVSVKGRQVFAFEDEVVSKTITLKIYGKQKVFNDFNITYLDYGHEHVSYAPNEPFTATVEVYSFLLSNNTSSDPVTIYQGVNQKNTEPVLWKNYSITLVHISKNQKKVVLKIMKAKEK